MIQPCQGTPATPHYLLPCSQ
uniref:Uncharacterized protein n=1 Tax=Arundo donax TaxID=35708 RepID=A0A0A8ZV77_ARUDO